MIIIVADDKQMTETTMEVRKKYQFKISIRTKLSSLFILLLFIITILIYKGKLVINEMEHSTNLIGNQYITNLSLLSSINQRVFEILDEDKNHIIANEMGPKYHSEQRILNDEKAIVKYLSVLRKNQITNDEIEHYNSISKYYDVFYRQNNTILNLSAEEKDSIAESIFRNQLTITVDNLIEASDGLKALSIENTQKIVAQYKLTNKNTTVFMLAFSAIAILIAFFAYFYTINRVSIILRDVEYNIGVMGYGDIPEEAVPEGTDEVGQIGCQTNVLRRYFTNIRQFVKEIGDGSFETQVNVNHGLGAMGNALNLMRNNIATILQEYKKQKKAEKGRNWATSGYAKFSELLRTNSDDMNHLYIRILSDLIQYIGAIQGALFIDNSENSDGKTFDLMAAYAYHRKKLISKQIEVGDGLVGRCAQEKQTIYLTDIPDNHFKIKSGLGDSNPNCILIVPMKLNNQIFGVIEIGSYKKFDKYHIEFVEKIGESFASTISSVRSNMRTETLLRQSQEQAISTAEQEHKMREHLESLKATQEESERRELEAIGFLEAVNHTVIRADFSINGLLMYANTKFYEATEYSSREAEGRHVSMFLYEQDKQEFSVIWDRLSKGGRHFEREVRYKTKNGSIWLFVTYSVVRNRDGSVSKVLFLAIDINKRKLQSHDLLGSYRATENSTIKAELKTDGSFCKLNDNFKKVISYSQGEIQNKTFFSLFADENKEYEFSVEWKRILEGIEFSGEIYLRTRAGDLRVFDATLTPLKNTDNKVYRIIFIANDITTQQKLSNEVHEKTEIIERQKHEMTMFAHKTDDLNQRMRREINERKQRETAMKTVFDELIAKVETENKQLLSELEEYKKAGNNQINNN